MDIYQQAEEHITRIENELKHLGDWQESPPDPQIFVDMGAFGSNKIPFTTWLQFVFIPNVRTLSSSHGQFPRSSSVAAYAYRNLEEDRYQHLNALLSGFDALF
jgi:uncharacterized protein YqcC (DUF446 family)